MDPNPVNMFEAALAEEGLDAEVKSRTDPKNASTIFRIKLQTRDGAKYRQLSISEMELAQAHDEQQLLASHASNVARSMKDEFTETVEWGENAIHIDTRSQLSATCRRCGTEATLSDVRASLTPIMMSESSVPQPSPPDLRSLSQHKKIMTLFGFLRGECEPGCPNSKYDDVYRNL